MDYNHFPLCLLVDAMKILETASFHQLLCANFRIVFGAGRLSRQTTQDADAVTNCRSELPQLQLLSQENSSFSYGVSADKATLEKRNDRIKGANVTFKMVSVKLHSIHDCLVIERFEQRTQEGAFIAQKIVGQDTVACMDVNQEVCLCSGDVCRGD